MDDDIQETITVTLPDPQNNNNHEFRPIMLDSDNDDITPDQTSNSHLYWRQLCSTGSAKYGDKNQPKRKKWILQK